MWNLLFRGLLGLCEQQKLLTTDDTMYVANQNITRKEKDCNRKVALISKQVSPFSPLNTITTVLLTEVTGS